MSLPFFSSDALNKFIDEAENEEIGLEFSSEEEDQVLTEMYGKPTEDEEAASLRYEDWFAKPGEYRVDEKEDLIEEDIAREKINLYYKKI